MANSGSNTISVVSTGGGGVRTVTSYSQTGPRGVAMLPDGSRAYVTDNGSDTVSVINTSTNAVASTITVGANPDGIEVSPSGARAYVANTGSNTISVINTSTNAVVATVTGLSSPVGLAVMPDGNSLYVANSGASSVSKISTSTNSVVATIALGAGFGQPRYIAIVPNRGPNSVTLGVGENGNQMNFSAGASVPDGSVVRYDWDFGDGHTMNDGPSSISYTYSAPGNYFASVKAFDNEGCSISSSSIYIGQTFSCIGNDEASSSVLIAIVDNTPPEITINDKPSSLSSSSTATFTFSGNESGVIYQCKVDDGSYQTCTSPFEVGGLTDGEHTAYIRATDAGNNTDQTPATYSWTVDTIAPPVEVQPLNLIPAIGLPVSFTFTSNDSSAQFECTVDSGGWVPCLSPLTLSGLTAGTHTLMVQARDTVGNYSVRAIYTWNTVSIGPGYSPNWKFNVTKNLRKGTVGIQYGVSSDEFNLNYANLILPRGIKISLKRIPRCRTVSSSKPKGGAQKIRGRAALLGVVYVEYPKKKARASSGSSKRSLKKLGLRHCGSGGRSLSSFISGKKLNSSSTEKRYPQVSKMRIHKITSNLVIDMGMSEANEARRVGLRLDGSRYRWLSKVRQALAFTALWRADSGQFLERRYRDLLRQKVL